MESVVNPLPDTLEALEEEAVSHSGETGYYALPSGLLVTWTGEKTRIVGRWDPPLETED